MHFYEPRPSDPAWLTRAATFHGHLGPWVTLGAMIGQDAVHRLRTPGQWKIEVICWMPPEKHKTPFSCILDGLQAASGATMGKRNIRLDFSPDVVRDDQPVIYVIRRPEGERPAEGLCYRLTDKAVRLASGISPDRLEEVSREIAAHEVEELLDVRLLSPAELDVAQPRP